MEGNLVIVESPAKARTIQKYLGEKYVVKPSFGHIRDLQEKKLGIDIQNGFKPDYVVPADKKKIVAELKKEAQSASVVWLASDEDREGEAISWHLAETLGLDMSRTRRIVFHEITKDAILNAIKNPREIDMNLVNAQQARRVLDRLVGYELSPVLWRKIQPRLSAGRVQSVALRLIVDREKEIMAFTPEPFYRVEGMFVPERQPSACLKAVLDTKFPSLGKAREFLEQSAGASYTISSLEEKQGSRFPAPPFTTSTLQQEASRKLHYPVSVTMRLAQSLYEKGLITYMRTDSTNLSTLALNTARKYINENFGRKYSHTRNYQTHTKGAQEAHEAIRPTFIENPEITGTAQEQKLYSLIWKRTVASQMSEAAVMSTSIKLSSDRRDETFTVQASRILFDGFLKVYMEGTDDDVHEEKEFVLPSLKLGDRLLAREICADCKYTQAPSRYSEATLVKKMEELGIGRPSTYSPTISTLTTGRGYISKGDKEGYKVEVENLSMKDGEITSGKKVETIGAEKGKLLPQEIGMVVSDYLVDHFGRIVDYDFTADVEKNFDQIADGLIPWNDIIAQFYAPFHNDITTSLEDKHYNHQVRELGTAPDGDVMYAKFGRYGAYIQKGEAEKKLFANLSKGQLIETITISEALKLFDLPRTVGQIDGIDVVVTKGRFGPYIKFDNRNISIPRGMDPLNLNLDQCQQIIHDSDNRVGSNSVLREFEGEDIAIINGRYGPYIKHGGTNYRIARNTDPMSLTLQQCKDIIAFKK